MQPVVLADFDETFAQKPSSPDTVPCKSPACFVNSYAPVSKPGVPGPFNNNTYFLHPTRKFEAVGAVVVRSGDFKCT
jgi:hypothetical protein